MLTLEDILYSHADSPLSCRHRGRSGPPKLEPKDVEEPTDVVPGGEPVGGHHRRVAQLFAGVIELRPSHPHHGVEKINRLEQEKEKTEAELHEVEKQVAAGDAHVQTIRKRLAEDGQAIKEKIIEHARAQSEFMLAGARKNINNQFLEARKSFQAELIEMAMSAASDKLVNEINDKDHEKLVNQFLYDLAETGH